MSPSASMPVLLRLAALFAVLFLIMPLLVVLPMSLAPESFLSLPTDGVSLQHYAGLWTDEGWSQAVTTSFAIAALSSAIALVLGTAFAVAAWAMRRSRVASVAPTVTMTKGRPRTTWTTSTLGKVSRTPRSAHSRKMPTP